MDHHIEEHSSARKYIRDIVLGMSDGITMPFSIAAGLTSALASTSLVLTAGFAEIVAGAISMGLGGYMAAKSEIDHYAQELDREMREIEEKPEAEAHEVAEILQSYGLTAEESAPLVASLRTRKSDWAQFMMRFELGLEQPDKHRAMRSALTIATAYVVGGIIPLSPYLLLRENGQAFPASILVTLVAFFAFGYLRGKYTATKPLKTMIHTVLVGGLAATAAFVIAKIFI